MEVGLVIRIGPSGWTHPALERCVAAAARRGLRAAQLPRAVLRGGGGRRDRPRPPARGAHRALGGGAAGSTPRTRLLVRVPSAAHGPRPSGASGARGGRGRSSAPRIAPARAPRAARRAGGDARRTGRSSGPRRPAPWGTWRGSCRPRRWSLAAGHRSWYERRALDVLAGAGWSLAHLDEDERWDAPPRRHRATGPVGMLRLVGQGPYEPARIGEVARRAREISTDVEDLYVIADNAGHQGAAPASGSRRRSRSSSSSLASSRCPVGGGLSRCSRTWRRCLISEEG